MRATLTVRLPDASDDAIRTYAAKIGAVIVTKDEDFVVRRILQEGAHETTARVALLEFSDFQCSVLVVACPERSHFPIRTRAARVDVIEPVAR
jgi:predicted nuclease of predicted toxin-antitoxin system